MPLLTHVRHLLRPQHCASNNTCFDTPVEAVSHHQTVCHPQRICSVLLTASFIAMTTTSCDRSGSEATPVEATAEKTSPSAAPQTHSQMSSPADNQVDQHSSDATDPKQDTGADTLTHSNTASAIDDSSIENNPAKTPASTVSISSATSAHQGFVTNNIKPNSDPVSQTTPSADAVLTASMNALYAGDIKTAASYYQTSNPDEFYAVLAKMQPVFVNETKGLTLEIIRYDSSGDRAQVSGILQFHSGQPAQPATYELARIGGHWKILAE